MFVIINTLTLKQQLACLPNSLLILTTKETSRFNITGSSPSKKSLIEKVFPYHGVINMEHRNNDCKVAVTIVQDYSNSYAKSLIFCSFYTCVVIFYTHLLPLLCNNYTFPCSASYSIGDFSHRMVGNWTPSNHEMVLNLPLLMAHISWIEVSYKWVHSNNSIALTRSPFSWNWFIGTPQITHWPLGDVARIYICNFQRHFIDDVLNISS